MADATSINKFAQVRNFGIADRSGEAYYYLEHSGSGYISQTRLPPLPVFLSSNHTVALRCQKIKLGAPVGIVATIPGKTYYCG